MPENEIALLLRENKLIIFSRNRIVVLLQEDKHLIFSQNGYQITYSGL